MFRDPRTSIKEILRSILKDRPEETFTTDEVVALQKEIREGVKTALKRVEVTPDDKDIDAWLVILDEELAAYCPRLTLWEHILDED